MGAKDLSDGLGRLKPAVAPPPAGAGPTPHGVGGEALLALPAGRQMTLQFSNVRAWVPSSFAGPTLGQRLQRLRRKLTNSGAEPHAGAKNHLLCK